MVIATKTDPEVDDWSINDDVVRLRLWGTDRSFPLPGDASSELIIGSTDSCWLRLDDDKQRVSRRHAALVRERGKWTLRDLGSRNGMKVDGARRDEVVLEAGIEIWIGGVTLVAESSRSIALRSYLGRLLGWTSPRTRAIDHALRSIRMAANRRAALVLCGEDDLVLIARSLHRLVLGPDRPFIVCDPRRKRSTESVRSAENYDKGMLALQAATRGSLCVWSKKPPADFAEVKAALRDPDVRVHLVVCARDASEVEAFGAVPITVPPLSGRANELGRIINEYASEALAELGLPRPSFPRADHDWVLKHAASSLPEIEKATRRLVVIREEGGNLNRAAARLRMARMSLAKWIGRRKLPIPTVSADD
jgi:hypothetical protein